MTSLDDTPPHETPFEVDGVPERALRTYARLWQFETWLRHMVYVELRALLGDDWGRSLKLKPTFLEADKHLTHMPTPEMNALSYAQLRNLTTLIEEYWKCFASYLPPKELWQAKLTEVFQIRNRIAHFRVGHADDYARVRQFLRDIDRGFWTFCTSYNDARPILPQADDAVTAHFLKLDPLPWVEIEPRQWARVGFVDKSHVVGVTVDVLTRPWASRTEAVDGGEGHIYDIALIASDRRRFDYPRLLERSQKLHGHAAYICLSGLEDRLRLTIPAVLGHNKIIPLVEEFIEIASYHVSRTRSAVAAQPDAVADEWPEYVLGPNHALTYLDPEMDCTFFAA